MANQLSQEQLQQLATKAQAYIDRKLAANEPVSKSKVCAYLGVSTGVLEQVIRAGNIRIPALASRCPPGRGWRGRDYTINTIR